MVVHPFSHGVPRVPRYSGYSLSVSLFTYGALTLCGRPSHAVLLSSSDHDASPNPGELILRFGLLRVRSPLLAVDVFSCPYLDVSVQGVPLVRLFDSTHDT